MPRRQGATHEEARAESRGALLEAGTECFQRDAPEEPFGALRIREICNRAGYSTGAFYAHWSDADSFHQDLDRYLRDKALFLRACHQREAGSDVGGTTGPAAIRRLAEADFRLTKQDRLLTALRLLGSETDQDGEDAQRESDEVTAHTYTVAHAGGLVPTRDELEHGELGVLIEALREGLQQRARSKPSDLDRLASLYATGVQSLVGGLTADVEQSPETEAPAAIETSGEEDTQSAKSCDNCFFRNNMLCALDVDQACATWRADTPDGLRPPRPPRFQLREPGRTTAAWAFPTPTAEDQAKLHS